MNEGGFFFFIKKKIKYMWVETRPTWSYCWCVYSSSSNDRHEAQASNLSFLCTAAASLYRRETCCRLKNKIFFLLACFYSLLFTINLHNLSMLRATLFHMIFIGNNFFSSQLSCDSLNDSLFLQCILLIIIKSFIQGKLIADFTIIITLIMCSLNEK